jgi:ring-1,2-phenylacetyl-CoA epoxidase subunit PaaD
VVTVEPRLASNARPEAAIDDDHHIQTAWQLLDSVADPEIPVVSIRELGILRAIKRLADGSLEVVVTPTYSGCPAMGQIEDDIHLALQQAKLPAKVITRLAPAWTTDWMTNSAREKLKAYGIAPPGARASGSSAIQFATKQIANYANNTTAKAPFNEVNVPCPRCGSPDTTETSHFASTACKALYKCLACLEPFDYFKPH